MKIGVLTGGGDVPGLNPCIKALVWRAIDEGHQVIGFRRGWWGPLNYNSEEKNSLSECTMQLDKQNTRTIDRTGGTFLHTSRTNPWKVNKDEVPDFLDVKEFKKSGEGIYDFTPHVLKNLTELGIDVLVPIGGDDTLGYGARLYEEGFPIVSIPKTMDNDVYGTDYCLGFSTAITRSVQFIHQLRTSTGSHERIAVVELFGRYSGQTALISAYLAGVDRCLISEVPFDVEKLSKLLVQDRKDNPSHYAMCVVSEGAQFIDGGMVQNGEADAFGHKKLGGIGVMVGEAIKQVTGINVINQQIAYLMRSGAPDSLDLMVATTYANMAMDLINRGNYGHMVSLQDGLYTYVPADIVTQGNRKVDVEELYDVEQYRPKIRKARGKPMFLY
jgi:6-phosphofructokinase